jgi:hypothetical protein
MHYCCKQAKLILNSTQPSNCNAGNENKENMAGKKMKKKPSKKTPLILNYNKTTTTAITMVPCPQACIIIGRRHV